VRSHSFSSRPPSLCPAIAGIFRNVGNYFPRVQRARPLARRDAAGLAGYDLLDFICTLHMDYNGCISYRLHSLIILRIHGPLLTGTIGWVEDLNKARER
jgi:hypothetical protein